MPSSPPRARIEALTVRAHAEAWSPRTDIDWWGGGPVVPAGVSAAAYVDSVSQLFHAERASWRIAAGLLGRLGDPAAEAFLATQIADEDRHAQALRGYLERLGDVAPVDRHLAAVFDHARRADVPPWVQIAALDVMLAHEVMPHQQRRLAKGRCPLMRQLQTRIAADDARHAVFGVAYLEQTLPSVAPAERAAGQAWLTELWQLWTVAVIARARPAGTPLHPDRGALAALAAHAAALLRQLGLGGDLPSLAPAPA